MRSGPAPVLLCALGAGLLTACGGSDPQGVIDETADSLSEVRSARIDLRMAVRPVRGEDDGLSLSLSGPVALPKAGELPKARVRYVRRAGAQETQALLTSTPTAAFVTVQGVTYRLPARSSAPLRQNAKRAFTLSDLHVDRWVVRPTLAADEGDTQRVTGRLDLAAAWRDIARARNEATGKGAELTERDLRTLREAVRTSSVSVLTGSGDHILRRLTASATFDAPPSLRSILGDVAVRLDFDLRLEGVNRSVVVRVPPGAVPLPAGAR